MNINNEVSDQDFSDSDDTDLAINEASNKIIKRILRVEISVILLSKQYMLIIVR